MTLAANPFADLVPASTAAQRPLLRDYVGDLPGFTAAMRAYRAGTTTATGGTPTPTPTPTPAPAPPLSPPATGVASGTTGSALSPQQQALENFANSAGMDFILKQGENAIQQNYAAHGALDSGAAMKALRDYAQNTAQSNYFMPYMGLLGGQQAVGAQAGSSVAGVGQNFGSTAANIYGGMGNTLQNGANGAAEAAATRGLAGANLGYGIANGLGQLASSFVPTSSGVYGGGPISVSPTGTSNYFGSNPFGGSI